MANELSLTTNITLSYEWEDGQSFDASQLIFLVQTGGFLAGGGQPFAAGFFSKRQIAGSGNTVNISTFDSGTGTGTLSANDNISASLQLGAGYAWEINGGFGNAGFDNPFGSFNRVATPPSQNIAVGSSNYVLQPASLPLTSGPLYALLITLIGLTTGGPNYDIDLDFTLAFTASYNGLPLIPKKAFTVNAVTPALDGNLASWPYVGHLVSGSPAYDGLNPLWQMVVQASQHVAALNGGTAAPSPSPDPIPVGVTTNGPATVRVSMLPPVEVRNVPGGSATQDFNDLLAAFPGATTLLIQVASVGCYISNVYAFLPYADNTALAAEQIPVISGQKVFGGQVNSHSSLTIGVSKLAFNVAISLQANVTLNGQSLANATVTSGIAQPLTTGGTPLKLPADFNQVTNGVGKTGVVNGELPFTHRWVTLTFQGNHGLVVFTWDGHATSGTTGIIYDGPDPYDATLVISNNGTTTLPDGSTETLGLITITVSGGQGYVKKGTQAGYQPILKAAISLATAGSPRLLLACIRSYVKADYTLTSLPGQPSTLEVDAEYTSYAARLLISNDFGETFEPGVDIGAESYFDGGAISDGRVTTASGGVQPILPIALGSYPKPSFCLPSITTFLVLPHGRLYLNGTHQGTASVQDWAAARLTEDVAGQSGWRNSNTPNQANTNTFSGIATAFPTGNLSSFNGYLQVNNTWVTSGSYQGTKGGGGKSGGPSQMRGAMAIGQIYPRIWSSADGGDTWQPMAPPSPPAGFQLYGHGISSDDIVYQKGQAYDGRRVSSTGFEGWTFYQPGPGDYINLQAVGIPATSPFPGNFWLARTAEGEIIRAIVNNPRGGGLALSGLRYGLGTGFQVPNPTGLTLNAIGSGGSLPPGPYQVGVTWVSNGVYGPLGETQISPLATWVISGPPSTVNHIDVGLTSGGPPGVGFVDGRAIANVYCSDAPGSLTLRLVGSIGVSSGESLRISALPPSNAPEAPSTNTTGPNLAQPSGTILYEGNYWDQAVAIMVSATGDGNNLAPLPVNVPANSGSSLAAWATMQRVVLALAIDDTIAGLVTENGGAWWRYTGYSKDNGQSCITGAPPGW